MWSCSSAFVHYQQLTRSFICWEVTTAYRSGSVVLARLVTSLLTGALRFIRLSELRYTHYYLLNNMSRSAPMICCQSKKRTWQVKGWTHIQSVLPVKRATYICSVPLPFDKPEKFGNPRRAIRYFCEHCPSQSVCDSAMNQLWLLCRRAQSPRRRCDEYQQDLYH